MSMPNFWKRYAILAVVMVLAACAREEEAPRDTGPGPESRAETLPSGDQPLVSIDAEGRVAPFGMASRQPREISEPDADVAGASAEAVVAGGDSTGARLYATQCIACHGAEAQGVQGLGANLVESPLVTDSDEATLVAFLQAGRAADASDNVTGIPMPAFAWMPDSDLEALAAYLKNLP